MKEDDPEFGLAAGDILECFPYRYDPGSQYNPEGKLTVVQRVSDGFDPECNVYWIQVETLGLLGGDQ